MNIENEIYFAPKIPLKDLDLSNKDSLIGAFEKRMSVYFLDAIALLNRQKKAYAAVIIELSLIDAIARYSTKNDSAKNRIMKMLQDEFTVDEKLAKDVFDYFRNGILHESHIKNSGQLCYKTSKAFELKKGCVIVNPQHFEVGLKNIFQSFIEKLKADETAYKIFHSRMRDDFEEEITFFKGTD